MLDNIITNEDLQRFKPELLSKLKSIFDPDGQPAKKWIKSDKVKKMLQVSAGRLQTLRLSRKLTYTRLGGTIYYDYEHIKKMMREKLR